MEKLLVNHRSNDEYLELVRTNQMPLGLGLGLPCDDYLRFKRANFNIILGHANVGKTYWVMFYLASLSHKHNLKHLIYSSENTVNGLKRNIIEIARGKKIVNMSTEELEEAKQWVESHFDFINTDKLRTIDEFMKEVQELYKHTKYDCLMIDPHNSFVKPRGVNSHEADYETASKLRLFAKKYDTAIYLCTHASTEALRKVHPRQHEKEGHTIPPNSADAEGGGKWVNRCDNFYVIHRYIACETDWMVTEVHCRKIKETETGGKPTSLNNPVKFVLSQGVHFLNEGINVFNTGEPASTNNLQSMQGVEFEQEALQI